MVAVLRHRNETIPYWCIVSTPVSPQVHATIETDRWHLNTSTNVNSTLSVLANSTLILYRVASFPIIWKGIDREVNYLQVQAPMLVPHLTFFSASKQQHQRLPTHGFNTGRSPVCDNWSTGWQWHNGLASTRRSIFIDYPISKFQRKIHWVLRLWKWGCAWSYDAHKSWNSWLMQKCWKTEPEDRPTFGQCKEIIFDNLKYRSPTEYRQILALAATPAARPRMTLQHRQDLANGSGTSEDDPQPTPAQEETQSGDILDSEVISMPMPALENTENLATYHTPMEGCNAVESQEATTKDNSLDSYSKPLNWAVGCLWEMRDRIHISFACYFWEAVSYVPLHSLRGRIQGGTIQGCMSYSQGTVSIANFIFPRVHIHSCLL